MAPCFSDSKHLASQISDSVDPLVCIHPHMSKDYHVDKVIQRTDFGHARFMCTYGKGLRGKT